MQEIEKRFKTASQKYNSGLPHYHDCFELSKVCIHKLRADAGIKFYGYYNGAPRVGYHVAFLRDSVSRPFRKDIFIDDVGEFEVAHGKFIERLKHSDLASADDIVLANKVIYTSVMAFACCYDLWKNSSRKTPGTFFEILMAGLFQIFLPRANFSKHISLEAAIGENHIAGDDKEKVSISTDLVISTPDGQRTAVVPLKITTRERVVQPYAHQRILDSSFPDKYESFLACISETQLDRKTQSVKQVCVPGTIKLFQRFLGNLTGIYYCDVPQRYAANDLARYVPVKPLGAIFGDVKTTIYSR